MKTYIVADCQINENTEEKISKWNTIVKDQDTVLILGTFTDKLDKSLLLRLKGQKHIMDYTTNPLYTGYTKEQLKEIGFYLVNDVFAYVMDLEYLDNAVHIIPDEKSVNTINRISMYGASAKSITKQSKVLEKNILSLSYSDWNNEPIEYNSIPRIYSYMKEFYSTEGGAIVG